MLAGIDPDTTPVGRWCDAAWAVYGQFVAEAGQAGGKDFLDGLDEQWQTWAGAAPATATAAAPAVPGPAPAARVLRPQDVPLDDNGQPRRPTKAEREAWAIAAAANGANDLAAFGAAGGARAGSAEAVGGSRSTVRRGGLGVPS